MQAQLELSLGNVLAQGWSLAWQAVRRRLNTSADSLATAGVQWAARLADAGQYNTQTQVSWMGRRDDSMHGPALSGP